MSKPTPGPWRSRELGSEGARILPDYGDVRERGKVIAEVRGRDTLTDFANARLIVAAVNACFAISPSNPLAVAEGMGEAIEALRGIEVMAADYMALRFDVKSDGFRLTQEALGKARAALARIEGKGE